MSMRATFVRLAQSATKRPLTLEEASAALLPPLPLYRGILRAHRRLPAEMRSLGDNYVQAEFRRHQKITNPIHIMGFLREWKIYLDGLPPSPNDSFKGRKFDTALLEKMTQEQIGQLYELMHATKGVWKPAQSAQGGSQSPIKDE